MQKTQCAFQAIKTVQRVQNDGRVTPSVNATGHVKIFSTFGKAADDDNDPVTENMVPL